MTKLKNVILCGGSGSRLWPLSRPKYPKQFMQIFNGKSLLQLTVERNASIADSFIIVVAENMLYHALNQLEELPVFSEKKFAFICEPVGKNTLPATLLAAFYAKEGDLLFVTPSDHVIEDKELYEESVKRGVKFAEDGMINTFGIKPLSAHTGYGYIEASGNKILSFKEKPSEELAKSYIECDNFYWNSGIFLAKKETFLGEARSLSPSLFEKIEKVYESSRSENLILKFSEKLMNLVESKSLDYELMEKTKKGSVLECRFGWSDVGNFESLVKYSSGSQKNILHNESENSFFFTDKKVVSFGLENIIAVEDSDTLFIGNINESERVKEVYSKIKLKEESELDAKSMDHKPWGSYYNLVDESDYKVKKIEVFAGRSLSLQKHFCRSEHWVVVKGEPVVTVEGVSSKYKVGDHIHINEEESHRLENNSNESVIIIEVQLGSYLGEDDIVRLNDEYERRI